VAAPPPVAAGARGPQVRERIVATSGDRDQVVDVGGDPAAAVADAAVAGEHLLPGRLPPSTARAPKLAARTAALGGQPPAAEAGFQSHPRSFTGSGWFSSRSSAIISATTPSTFELRSGASILQEWMGHRDIKTTMIYADYQASDQERELVERALAGTNPGTNLSASEDNSEQDSVPEDA
jgi:hypothetical protein